MELSHFLNFFDIFCLVIISFSALFSLKSGLLKNLLNLVKWVFIILAIKYSFEYLRVSFKETLGLSPTLTDIAIFVSVFIVSYVILTLLNKLLIGLIGSDRSGSIDKLFGLIFGIIRGYIIIVIFFSVLSNWNLSKNILHSYENDSVLYELVNKGRNIFIIIPRQIEDKLELI